MRLNKKVSAKERSLKREVCGWVGGWVCVCCGVASKNQWGNIGSELSLLFKHL